MRKLLLWLIAIVFTALSIVFIWTLVLPMYATNGPNISYDEFLKILDKDEVFAIHYDDEKGAVYGILRDTDISTRKFPKRYDFRVVVSEEVFLSDIVKRIVTYPKYNLEFGEKTVSGNVWHEYAIYFVISAMILVVSIGTFIVVRIKRSGPRKS